MSIFTGMEFEDRYYSGSFLGWETCTFTVIDQNLKSKYSFFYIVMEHCKHESSKEDMGFLRGFLGFFGKD